jgi:hypothetical protein
MKPILVFMISAFACCLLVACGQDDSNHTPMDLGTRSMMLATAPSVHAPVQSSQQKSQSEGSQRHVKGNFVPVNDSGITGHVNVQQLPHGGVNISVVALGLTTGEEYLSLYYENHTCALEPYAENDVIGEYTGNAGGLGQTQNKLEDDLDEVNSISVRRKSDFALLACADIHPE